MQSWRSSRPLRAGVIGAGFIGPVHLEAPRRLGVTDYPAGHIEGFPDTFKRLCRAVYQDIAAGRSRAPLCATAADGHHELKVCEAILESHRRRAWVKI